MGERERERERERESVGSGKVLDANSGRPKRNDAICRCTAHEAISINAKTYNFIEKRKVHP